MTKEEKIHYMKLAFHVARSNNVKDTHEAWKVCLPYFEYIIDEIELSGKNVFHCPECADNSEENETR